MYTGVSNIKSSIVDKRYGKLVVVGMETIRKAICQCDCGKTIVAWRTNLVQNRKKSCGCLKSTGKDITGEKIKTKFRCANCGKSFFEHPSQIKNASRAFCSRECYKSCGRKSTTCKTCGKSFIVVKSKQSKFCSKDCKTKSLKKNRTCKTCGKPIVGYSKTYCSSNCHWASARIEKTCSFCGKKFFYQNSKRKTSNIGKFCSWDCFVAGHPKRQDKIEKSCEICNKSFQVAQRHKKQRFCSSECFGRHLFNMCKENPALVEKMIARSSVSKKGWYVSYVSGKRFFYHSSYELIRMISLDGYGLCWEKNKDLAIPYIASDGREHLYIPDFIVEEGGVKYLEESKGYERENDQNKFAAGKKYAKNNGMVYRVLRTKKENKMRPSELKVGA